MLRKRLDNGSIKFIKEDKDNEQIKLLNRISNLEKEIRNLKLEIEKIKAGN